MTKQLLDRFLRYVQIDTQSNDQSSTCPSTPGQLELQRLLFQELCDLGADEVRLTKHGYVLATIPATSKRARVPTVAFVAHVDTAPDFSGKNVKPRVHRNYDGKPIRFPDDRRLVLDPAVDQELAGAKGKTIVTASGSTLLGSDDKAGVATIMTLAEHLLRNPKINHGLVRICFTPDEEIGRGVDKLDLGELKAQVGYTLDGHAPGEVCWETFSGDRATVTIEGVSTHPGDAHAKGMVNAAQLAARLLCALPRERCAPETTAAGEGYIHPIHLSGTVERATVRFILRDFEIDGLAHRRAILQSACRALQVAEPQARVRCRIEKQYRNMAYWLKKDMRPVELARDAFRSLGLSITEERIRGGTDGSRLTELGLPTPNLFCGEHNIHGPLEWVAVEEMVLAVKACVKLLEVWEQKGAGYHGWRAKR